MLFSNILSKCEYFEACRLNFVYCCLVHLNIKKMSPIFIEYGSQYILHGDSCQQFLFTFSYGNVGCFVNTRGLSLIILFQFNTYTPYEC